jgi:branched-chain amino acid transport system permease protein
MKEAQYQLERIGMGQYLHELAGNLAMGPQRLMEIARALCCDPALLLLDEQQLVCAIKKSKNSSKFFAN